MNIGKLLKGLGVLSIIMVIIAGSMVYSIYSDFAFVLSTLGVILSLILVGVGEIVDCLRNGGKKNENKM